MLHVIPGIYSATYCVVVSILCSATEMCRTDTGDSQLAYFMEGCERKCSIVPQFTSLIHSLITARKVELLTKINFLLLPML
jgi:hypothetical protein